MAASRLYALLRPSILRKSRQIPPKFHKTCFKPSSFRCYTSSALSLDSDASALATDDSSAHPWPEWVNFVDRLQTKGYLIQNAEVKDNGADNKGVSVCTDMKLVKDACLSFGRDRFDIFRSLSTQDIQTIVEKGCPNLFRKAVNSSKRLRAYLKLDEEEVCSSCILRGACDRANIILNEAEAVPRTVDVVRVLLFYALDPLAFSRDSKPPGREIVESSARKLLLELIRLDETPRDPDLPNPSVVTLPQKKSDLSNISDREKQKNVGMKPGDWVCSRCNVTNSSTSRECHGCGNESPRAHKYDVEMKKGDWICPRCDFLNYARNRHCLKCSTEKPVDSNVSRSEKKKGDWDCPRCNFMNFERNVQCLKCSTDKPEDSNVDRHEKKKGDWDCPRCSFLNYAKNRQCYKCEEPRPQRKLQPGDWECPECDFVNFSRNTVCKKCNLDRPSPSSMLNNDNEDDQMWEKPY